MWRRRFALGSLLAAGLLVAGGASAQGPDKLAGTTPEQRAGAQTAFMKAKLDLSAEQIPKVEAINLKYAQQMQPILESSERPLAKMGETRRVQQAKDAELQRLLSPEQYANYLAAKDEMRQHVEQKLIEKHKAGGG
jgi:hypothetical protein